MKWKYITTFETVVSFQNLQKKILKFKIQNSLTL